MGVSGQGGALGKKKKNASGHLCDEIGGYVQTTPYILYILTARHKLCACLAHPKIASRLLRLFVSLLVCASTLIMWAIHRLYIVATQLHLGRLDSCFATLSIVLV